MCRMDDRMFMTIEKDNKHLLIKIVVISLSCVCVYVGEWLGLLVSRRRVSHTTRGSWLAGRGARTEGD